MTTIEHADYNELSESDVARLSEKYNISILTMAFQFADSVSDSVLNLSSSIQKEIFSNEKVFIPSKIYPYLYFLDKNRNILCEALLFNNDQIKENEIEKIIIKLLELPPATIKIF